jgi:O-antigen ligase
MKMGKSFLIEFRECPGFYFLCLTLFLMPFPRSWALYPQGFFFLTGLVLWVTDFRKIYRSFSSDFEWIAPLLAYFAVVTIWGLRSSNFVEFTGPYLMFLLIPLLGYPVFSSAYFRKNLPFLVKSFIFGLLAICIFEFARALYNSLTLSGGKLIFNPNIDFNISATSFDYLSAKSRFRSVELSFLEHPPYLALKIIFAVALLFEFRNELNMSKHWLVLFAAILIIFLYSLSTRIGFIIPAFIILYYLYRYFAKHRLRLVFIFILPFFLFGSYKIANMNQRVREKSDLLITGLTSGKGLIKADPRFISWITSSELILQKPLFGVGPDAREILAAEYLKKGFTNESELRLNAHNQFLETQLTFGIIGSLILIWIFSVPACSVRKSSKPALQVIFMIITLTSFLFESVLVRQWGIMFFVMFYCILIFLPWKNMENT